MHQTGDMAETRTASTSMVMHQQESPAGMTGEILSMDMTADMLQMDMTSVEVHRQTAGLAASMGCLGARLLLKSCKQGTGANHTHSHSA